MATVHIPTLLQTLSSGAKVVDIEGTTVRQVIDKLEERFPGMKAKLVADGRLPPNISVSVDGELATIGLLEKVGEDSEVIFLPAIGGGEPRHSTLELRKPGQPTGAGMASPRRSRW